ncbi:hypothetical protein J4H92_02365 [Leucobacter weissii]|uniref:Peptidase M10 metallopeptidase domain-containing protein n=1 Tax=Leucobacter weissii TaxID=1983706 RepID=A0A939S4Z4_9MICO|nr:hypothetical protein [Leucobacter weissii]MBO1900789.1 hypothetical protein [Leucobacter weissii]
MPTRTFGVRYSDVSSTWKSYFDAGRSRWNSAGIGVDISKNPDTSSKITAGEYSGSWLGLYAPWETSTGKRVFTIRINSRTIAAHSGGNYGTWFMGTATHEFGHALSLDDDPRTTRPSLMHHSRDRNTVVRPTAYDKEEVLRIY